MGRDWSQESKPLEDGDPKRLGDYAVRARLAEGGMGIVFLGHTPSGHRVLLKALKRTQVEDETARARFAQETEVLAKLQGASPTVTVTLVDAQPMAPTPYIVMEYVKGQTLHHLAPVAITQLGIIALGLAQALDACHQLGIVHNDITPANVLVTSDGVRVIDWGLATYPGARLPADPHDGTYGFMAPERFGDAPIGPAADIFSWACTMAYAATGRRPFDEKESFALVVAVVSGEPDLHGVSPLLLPALQQAFDKSAERRPDASQLVTLLGDGPRFDPMRVKEMRAALWQLEQSLFEVESDPAMDFIRSLTDAGGETSQLAKEIIGRDQVIWTADRSLARAAVEKLETALAGRRRDEVERLLGPAAVDLPGGRSTGVGALLADLQRQVQEHGAQARDLASRVQSRKATLDSISKAAAEVLDRAAALGIDRKECAGLQRALKDAAVAVAADPGFADLQDLEARTEAGRSQVDEIEAKYKEIAEQAAVALPRLEEIEGWVIAGREAFAACHELIVDPKGLRNPPSSADIHRIRSELEAITRAAAGDWRAVAGELGARLTRDIAQEIEEMAVCAREAFEANSVPIVRRKELRDELDAYRAMAGDFGRLEELEPLYASAEDTLYTAPCNLRVAAERVWNYIQAIHDGRGEPDDGEPRL